MIAGVYVFRWTISNGSCVSSNDDVQVTINALPGAANAGPDQEICNVSSVTLAGNVPASGTGLWSLISGPNAPVITSASNPGTTVTGMVAGVYIFRWTISSGACANSTDDVQIIIDGLPSSANAGIDQSLCNATSVLVSANVPLTGTGTWTFVSGPNTPVITSTVSSSTSITGLIQGIYIFRWTPSL